MRSVTRDLPGTGGMHKATPEDFVVEEVAAYAPSGEGGHTFLRIEKRGLTTAEAVARVCRALGVDAREAGVAGQKDRQALTRQWVSVPGVEPERALAVEAEGVKVLEAKRHGNKLRTGHLAGNRFVIRLRGVVDGGKERAERVLERLGREGLPNYFGAQRFGARGDNAARGKALIVGGGGGGGRGGRVGGGEKRMLVSAYQAQLFNRYLDRRIDDGVLATAVVGDVMKKTDTGGLFVVGAGAGEVEEVQERLGKRAVVVTGPMFGHKMMAPPEGTEAARREAEVLAEEGIEVGVFARMGKLAEGTRRALVVAVQGVRVTEEAEGVLVVEFALPSGAYATGVIAEVTKVGVEAGAGAA